MPFSDEETTLVELVAQMLEYELERKQQEAELQRRQNLINVLDRVLRHNLRNELTVIRGHVNILADRVKDRFESIDVITEKIEKLVSLSETAREFDTIVTEESEDQWFDLAALAERVVDAVARDYPETTLRIEDADGVEVRATPSLERAIHELVENAAKHSPDGATVTVSFGNGPNRVRLSVADEGPGLPTHEQEVLRGGDETPLLHGSGLGLWLVYRIVSNQGGEIHTDVDESGTRVVLSIPRPSVETDPAGETTPTPFEQVYDRFRAVFDEAFDGMLIVDDDRRCMDVNESAVDLLDLPERELLGCPLDDLVADEACLRETWDELVETGDARGTTDLDRPDGSEQSVEYTVSMNIVPGQHLVVFRDVTEEREREQELRETKQRLELALSETGTGFFEWNAGTNEVTWSEELEEMVGLEPDGFEGTYQAFANRLHPEDVDRVVNPTFEALEADEQLQLELPLRHEDGHYIWIEGRRKPIETDEGKTVVDIVTDVTDRKEREQELRSTKRRLEAIIEASPAAIVALDRDGVIQLWSPAATDVFGYDREEAVGKPILDLDIHTADQSQDFRENIQRVTDTEEVVELALERRTREGDVIHLAISLAPLRNDDGDVMGVLGIAENRTDEAGA